MQSQRTRVPTIATVAALALIASCKYSAKTENSLILATTTSTQDSGLLDVLLPTFEEQTGIDVQVVAVGSGQALELGRRGDADVLLTHAPVAELKFIDEGWGQNRRPVMYNDFILVGPKSDPARVKGMAPITKSFTRLSEQEALFVTRGDESGTHQKEQEIWAKVGRQPQGVWYINAGAGMAEVLRMAHEKQAYAIADRGTFLALRKNLELEILSEREPDLQNDYAVMITNASKHPHVNAKAAQRFVDYLTDPATKMLIAEYGVERFGEPLFHPK